MERNPFKIVERGDWLKIEIFLFKNISRPFVSWLNWSENFDQRLRRKKSGRFVTGTCYSRKHGEPCRFNIGRRKKEKQLGSVSSLCVPCNNSLLNPRCPSVRPYGTTTRRFKTKHTLHDTDYNDTIHRGTRTHTYMVHTHTHIWYTHVHSLSRYKHYIYITRARNSCIENSRSIVASSTR